MAKRFLIGLLILVALQVLTIEAAVIHHLKPRSNEEFSEIQFPWTSWLQGLTDYLNRNDMETAIPKSQTLPRCGNRFEFYFGNCIPHPRRVYL